MVDFKAEEEAAEELAHWHSKKSKPATPGVGYQIVGSGRASSSAPNQPAYLTSIPATFVATPSPSRAGAYSPAGQTLDEAQKKAAERNLDIRLPEPNELFVDIDNAPDYARFKQLVEMFGRVEPVVGWVETPSASGGQHRHIVVTLGRHVSEFERIALQAMLGSDLKREILSYERRKTGSCPHPTMFFEPKAGVKPVPKKTGFNCTRCNQKNDFAEANQDDGTYVCFECRVEE